jgi:predicted RNA-binding Zn-ribbon protein involved in translation (DUF1610 family)
MMDTELTDKPICPHCGFEEPDAWEMDFGFGVEGEGEFECGKCGKPYICTKSVVISYTTKAANATRADSFGDAGGCDNSAEG